MKKLRCIITEDEPIARKILKEFIEEVDYLELAGAFDNAVKTEAFLQEHDADILFLDIEMPKVSGLEYLKNCRVKPLVIITTAYPQYALEGYELDVIDYLLKPIAFTRFLKAVQKAREYTDLVQASGKSGSGDFLFVRTEKKIEKVDLNDILFIESTGNYISIVSSRKKLIAYLTLKSLEDQLPANIFLKIHRSFLVNFSKIESMEDNQIKVGDTRIPVSRNYAENVAKAIGERLLKR